jgi:hypothetical protein
MYMKKTTSANRASQYIYLGARNTLGTHKPTCLVDSVVFGITNVALSTCNARFVPVYTQQVVSSSQNLVDVVVNLRNKRFCFLGMLLHVFFGPFPFGFRQLSLQLGWKRQVEGVLKVFAGVATPHKTLVAKVVFAPLAGRVSSVRMRPIGAEAVAAWAGFHKECS